MFDQTHWGHIIEWKGLGKLVHTGPSNLTSGRLCSVLVSVINNPEVKLCLKQVKEAVISENGLDIAIYEDYT